MDRQITHPSKEQVRAYMNRREAAHRPPPAPAEIRRQLDWRLVPDEDEHVMVRICLLPSTCSQLTAQLIIDWMFASSCACMRFAIPAFAHCMHYWRVLTKCAPRLPGDSFAASLGCKRA
jgi:hypothetical protein